VVGVFELESQGR